MEEVVINILGIDEVRGTGADRAEPGCMLDLCRFEATLTKKIQDSTLSYTQSGQHIAIHSVRTAHCHALRKAHCPTV